MIESNNSTSKVDAKKTKTGALVALISLFFMWGFITCMNDILIPFMKRVFNLSWTESMLIQFCFFGAYFIGSLIYFLISAKKGDPIVKIGYKNGIILGLLISAIGCGLFYPAASIKVYGLFLSALFILGLGFTLLQIAANPYVSLLGSAETASKRLNLSQAFNSLGTTLAPILGGYLVFHFFAEWGAPFLNQVGKPITTDDGHVLSALSVQLPYILFSLIFVILSVIFYKMKLPSVTTGEIEKGAGALKFRHLKLGIVAIFMYVGAEVCVGSFILNYTQELLEVGESIAKRYLAFYWGGAMIGRFLGSIIMGERSQIIKKLAIMTGVSIIAYAFIYSTILVESNFNISFVDYAPFLLFIGLNLIGFIIGKSAPGRTLGIFATIVIVLLITTILCNGKIALWSICAIGLFNSIMWPNIFTLAIDKLGKYTSQGSSLLVMAILGGAILPLLQGAIADYIGAMECSCENLKLWALKISFIVPILGYAYLVYYGFKGCVFVKPKK